MRKMLIVEDENLISDFLSKSIDWSDIGITDVYTCTNGEEAIALMSEHDIDIVLTDISMPKMGGLELVKRVKLIFGNIKFIIISGYDDFHLVKEFFKLGASDYILKSELVPDELKKIVAAVLAKKTDNNFSDSRNIYLTKETRLKKLLWGSKSLNSDDLKFNFRFGTGRLCVTVFRILNFNSILKREWDGESELLKYGLSNLINELLDDIGFGEVVIGNDGEVVFIFSLSEGNRKEDIMTIINDIKSEISIYFNFNFRIGICSCNSNEPGVLYTDAKKAVEYCFVKSTSFADYDEVMSEVKGLGSEKNKLLELFERYVLNYNFMRIISDFEKFTPDLLKKAPYEDVCELYRGYFEILNIVIVQNRWLSGLKLKHEEIINTGTLIELNAYLKEILIKLKETFSNDANVVNKVKKFIDENYYKNISSDTIASDFFTESRKLSREFSKTYGISLSKYINEVRMKNAMQLITTSDFLLYEIAEMVGYTTYESFSRNFYNYWGQWPKNVKLNK